MLQDFGKAKKRELVEIARDLVGEYRLNRDRPERIMSSRVKLRHEEAYHYKIETLLGELAEVLKGESEVKVEIVPSPRPEDEEAQYRDMCQADNLNFEECDTCRVKPGSPTLCRPCLHNRWLIDKLKRDIENERSARKGKTPVRGAARKRT